jgi:hypothetical protein
MRLANRPILRALNTRRHTAPVYETVPVEPEQDADRMIRLVLALAPMAFAFFYLAVFTMFLF